MAEKYLVLVQDFNGGWRVLPEYLGESNILFSKNAAKKRIGSIYKSKQIAGWRVLKAENVFVTIEKEKVSFGK